jgi:hypothetical protein
MTIIDAPEAVTGSGAGFSIELGTDGQQVLVELQAPHQGAIHRQRNQI